MRIGHSRHATAQDHPAGDDDKQQGDDLDDSDAIHPANTPVGQEGVQQRHADDDRDRNAAFLPFSGLAIGREEDVGREDDAPRGGESQRNGLDGEEDGDQQFRTPVDGLEIDLFASAAGDHTRKLEPDAQSGGRQQQTQNPEHQRGANAADALGDGRRGGKDACADDTADTVTSKSISILYKEKSKGEGRIHQKRRREQAQMSTQSSLGVFLKGELADSHGVRLDFIISAPGQRICLLGLDPRFFLRRRHRAPERGIKFFGSNQESDIFGC